MVERTSMTSMAIDCSTSDLAVLQLHESSATELLAVHVRPAVMQCCNHFTNSPAVSHLTVQSCWLIDQRLCTDAVPQGGHKPGKPGILRDSSEYGKLREFSREFCAISGKNCNKQSIFSSSFKYVCKTAVDWV